MPRSAETYLIEIQRASTYLLDRTKGMDFDTYNQDETLRFAVERNFIIIGEAAACLRRDHPQVSALLDAKRIIGFRNFVVHQYWSVDHKEVWSTLTTKVGPLLALVGNILKQPGAAQP
jgi:uncharacterized protein with HEPN domain